MFFCMSENIMQELEVPAKLASMPFLTNSSSCDSSIEIIIAYFVCGSVVVGSVGIGMCISGV